MGAYWACMAWSLFPGQMKCLGFGFYGRGYRGVYRA